jgi:hypothetical protein
MKKLAIAITALVLGAAVAGAGTASLKPDPYGTKKIQPNPYGTKKFHPNPYGTKKRGV